MASKRKSPGYWKSLETCLDMSKSLMEEHYFDKLPSGNKLKELGYSSLSAAISIHHGGLNNFREKHFGEEQLTKPPNYWKNLENTLSEVNNLMNLVMLV